MFNKRVLCLYRTKKRACSAACGDIAVSGWYLYGAFAALSDPQPPDVSSIVALVVWFSILEAIIRGFLAIENSVPQKMRELIEQVSNGYSYILVCVCLFLLMGQILRGLV